MNQNPPETLSQPSGLSLISSHFAASAKAHAEAEARKPTAEQIRAAEAAEHARRLEAQSARKSSAEIAAKAREYAPGPHRAYLLMAAGRREAEELAEGIAPVRPAPESAAAQAARYEMGEHRGYLLLASHREEQAQREAALTSATTTAPQPAANAGKTNPWGRLAAKIKAEGLTGENRAEYQRLKAGDAQEAAAKASDTAAPPAGFFARLKNALDAGASPADALAQASSAAPAPASATAVVPAAKAPQPAGEVSPWDRLAARIKQEGYSESCRAEHERLEGNNAWRTTAVSPRGFFGGIIASVKSGKVQPPSDPIKFVRLMAMRQEHEASEARRQASPTKSEVAGWIRAATKKQRMAGAF